MSTTIFEQMSRLAQDLGAINLGQGFPDLPEPTELIEAAATALRAQSNQYPPMRGLPALRQAIAGYYAARQGLTIADDEIVVTSGATEALAASILALVGPGDEVIIVQPAYDAYMPLVRRAGGLARFVDMTPPDWDLPVPALAAAITPRTRLIVLNTPNNPTGTQLSCATLEALAELCVAHDLRVLCDEVWEAMLFDGRAHVSSLHVAALRARAVKVGSAGKIFSLTGWKVGWAIAAPPLAQAIAASHQYLTFTTATPLQWAVAVGLALPPVWHDAHLARYAALRDQFIGGLTAAGFVVLPADATWFVSIDLAASGLAGDDVTIAEQMVREVGVAAIPISAFYAERPETGFLRLCFAKREATLEAALESLAAFRIVDDGKFSSI